MLHSAVNRSIDSSDDDIFSKKEGSPATDDAFKAINDSSPIHQYISNVLDDDDDDDDDDNNDNDDDDNSDEANESKTLTSDSKHYVSISLTNKTDDDDSDDDDDDEPRAVKLVNDKDKILGEAHREKEVSEATDIDEGNTYSTAHDVIIDNDNDRESINSGPIEIDLHASDSTFSHLHSLFPTISDSPSKKDASRNFDADQSAEVQSTNGNISSSGILETKSAEPTLSLKHSISQSSFVSDVTENSYKRSFGDSVALELSKLCQPSPLSPFAIKAGVIYEGWLEKTSSITGLWLKRYYVLSESNSEFCVLRVYGKAINTKWGMAPINLKTVIPISCVQSVTSSAAHKGKELKLTVFQESGRVAKEHGYCNISDAGSINSDDIRNNGVGKTKCMSLKAPDAQSRLLWVTFIQSALDALHEAIHDRLELS